MIENFTQLDDDQQSAVETFGVLELCDIDKTLKQRGERYGPFKENARIIQAIKKAMVDSPNWSSMTDDKREALEMVALKVGRILTGDPEYKDSWHDIIGYVRRVEETLE